jgi:hypothetical protein
MIASHCRIGNGDERIGRAAFGLESAWRAALTVLDFGFQDVELIQYLLVDELRFVAVLNVSPEFFYSFS